MPVSIPVPARDTKTRCGILSWLISREMQPRVYLVGLLNPASTFWVVSVASGKGSKSR